MTYLEDRETAPCVTCGGDVLLADDPICEHGDSYCWAHDCAVCDAVFNSELTVHDMPQRSPEWYEARRGIVTASMVGRLLTPTLKVADNDTARGIVAALVAERIAGTTEDTYLSSDMIRGIDHEPYARDIYSGHYQQAVEVGFMVRRGDDWALGYSPDGVVADEGLVEIKCPRAKGHVQTILADEVPPFYMAQLQAGLLVSGRKWIDYVSFRAGLPLYVKRVLPDPAWHEAIVEACRVFEHNALEMQVAYDIATDNLPATEPIPDYSQIEAS